MSRLFLDGGGILSECVCVYLAEQGEGNRDGDRDLGMLVLIQKVNVALIDG